jgi:hypothetical protein
MAHLLLDYLPTYILSGSLATVGSVLIGIQRGLKRAGWPDGDRKRAIGSVAALLMVWFLAALAPAWLGLYRRTTSGIPTIQYGILIPLLLAFTLYWRWRLLRSVIETVPQEWLAGIQFFRVMGLIFLLLYAAGSLPGVFALPAGLGDVAIGLLAPVVGVAYARKPQAAAGWLRTWNLLGLADLIVALTTGFLSSRSPLQRFALDHPNDLITAFPLVMIPVFLVPLAILLHLASLKDLSRSQTADRVLPVASAGELPSRA